jgi:hypothetical protein
MWSVAEQLPGQLWVSGNQNQASMVHSKLLELIPFVLWHNSIHQYHQTLASRQIPHLAPQIRRFPPLLRR